MGMTKGSFYHYFKSKEEVFAEIINEYFLNSLSAINYEGFSQVSLQQFYKITSNTRKSQTQRRSYKKRNH